LSGKNGFLKRRRLDTHASLALLGGPFRAHRLTSQRFYPPDLRQVFCGTMKKATQQCCHALSGVIAFVFGTIVSLDMHD
jgi:hypothetical protein